MGQILLENSNARFILSENCIEKPITASKSAISERKNAVFEPKKGNFNPP